MKVIVAMMLIFFSSNIWAERQKELVVSLVQCIDKNKAMVSKNIVSLEEGAQLITESLCSFQATDFANFKANRREDTNRPSYSERFMNEMFVIRRDIRLTLFWEKVKLGSSK